MDTKLCRLCGIEKPVSEFYKRKVSSDRYGSYCKVCHGVKQRECRHRDPEAYRERMRKHRARFQDPLEEYKRQRGCANCGEREPCCLAFHHLDPTKKDFTLSSVTWMREELIQAEIAKCVVICHNCHSRVHAGILDSRVLGRAAQASAFQAE